MQRYKLLIEFCGASYGGWQIQPIFNNVPTIQYIVQNAAAKFIGHPTKVTACSRTDAGVHALGMVAHVDFLRKNKKGDEMPAYDTATVKRGMNHWIGTENIRLREVEKVPSTFHARFSTKSKTYLYRVLSNCPEKPVFHLDKFMVLQQPLDIEPMQAVCKIFEGRHDFTSFKNSKCTSLSPIRRIDKVSVRQCQVPFEYQHYGGVQAFEIEVTARSFLYNQVRNMAGAIVSAGLLEHSPRDIQHILDVKNRSLAPKTAPAGGLYLKEVNYPKFINGVPDPKEIADDEPLEDSEELD